MNFQNLPTINDHQKYLDIAFKHAKTVASHFTYKTKSEISKQRKKELVKIDVISKKITEPLNIILNAFPIYQDLDTFHRELFNCYIDADQYKQDLSKIKFAYGKILEFSRRFSGMIKAKNEKQEILTLSKEFYGRISSIMKRVDKPLIRLEEFRKKLKQLPDIKDECINIALFGFPNVGKSTILSKITSAKPKIANYSFTTKNINIGYKKIRSLKIQIMDTPGTLNRFDKMNDIEKIAYLVVTELADLVIYVFDPTEGYPLDDQKKLYEMISDKNRVVALISKTDLVEEDILKDFKESYSAITLLELDDIFEKLVSEKEKEMLKNKN